MGQGQATLRLPETLFGYVRRTSGKHQLALAALSVAVFALSAVALAEGGIKLVLNIYRGWVSERAVRQMRRLALHADAMQGEKAVELSVVLSEIEPVGGFVGSALSEPLLQGGILFAVFGYMLYLQPRLAALSFLVFAPQLVFVPLMQAAINRRVKRRVLTMREVSDGIVREASPDGFQAQRIDEVFTLHMGMYKLKFGMNFFMNLSHHAGVAVALAFGGWLVIQGRIEVGTVVAFISGIDKLNDPWGDAVNWFRDMTVNRVKYRLLAAALTSCLGKETRAAA